MDARGLSVPEPPSVVAGVVPEVASGQLGMFTRAQARAEGWSDSRQRRLLRDGVWIPVLGSVVRHQQGTPGPWQLGWAVGLTGRIPSHGTAGAIWGYAIEGQGPRGIVEHGGGPVRGVVDHRLALDEGDVVEVGGLRITSELRTVADLVCLMPTTACIATLTDAFRRGLLDLEDLATINEKVRGRRGGRRASRVLASCGGRPWSVLEWRFQQIALRVSSHWRFNVVLTDVDLIGPVDAVLDGPRVVVELDGKRYHGADRFQRDRSRDQRLAAAGYVVLRFTWQDVSERPEMVLSILRRTISQRARRAS